MPRIGSGLWGPLLRSGVFSAGDTMLYLLFVIVRRILLAWMGVPV